ncbi:MAG: hypothetical protein ACLPN6_20915 [Streptosporangiaceae bacterium]|nr:hypothetical protein [Actinomycetota bacterium]
MPNAFETLDDSKVTRFQWKIMFVSGMETPRFAMAGGAADEAEQAIAAATGTAAMKGPARESTARARQGAMEGFRVLARSKRMLWWLIGTAGCWLTAALLPEPKGKSLEQLTFDAYAAPQPKLEHA